MKHNMKKIVAIFLCSGLVITCTGTQLVEAKTSTKTVTKPKSSTASSSVKGEGTGVPFKNETVFVTSDVNGKTKSILVSDWLKNEKHFDTLLDSTNLDSVENIKGSEKLTISDNKLSVDSNGSDIYYRGSLPAETKLPVSLAITYLLDGKEISGKELKGASGKLEFTIKYTNETSSTQVINGKEYQVCVPFLASTILMIPSSQVSEMNIEHGKIIESGEMDIIVGYGFPGINQSMNLKSDLINDTVHFSAQVKDYDPSTLMTYLTSEPFIASDLEKAVDIKSLTTSLASATDTTGILSGVNSTEDINGLFQKIQDSIAQLNSGAIELHTGIGKVDANIELLKSGLTASKNGSSQLASGLASAHTSSITLSQGASSLSLGINQLSSAITGMYNGITTNIATNNSNLNAVNTGISQLSYLASQGGLTVDQQTQLTTLIGQKAGLEGANTALNSLKSQMDQGKLIQNMAALVAGSKQVKDGSAALSVGLGTVAQKMKDLSLGLEKLESGAILLKDGTSQLFAGSKKLSDGTSLLANSFNGNFSDLLNSGKALQAAAKEYMTFTQLTKDGTGKVSFIIKSE